MGWNVGNERGQETGTHVSQEWWEMYSLGGVLKTNNTPSPLDFLCFCVKVYGTEVMVIQKCDSKPDWADREIRKTE